MIGYANGQLILSERSVIKKHEEARSKRNNYADMPGCVSYQINSNADKFVVSTRDNKLVETIHKYEDSNENPKRKSMQSLSYYDIFML